MLDSDYEYDLGVLEGSIAIEESKLDNFKRYVDQLSDGSLSTESVSMLMGVSVEGSKFDMITAYLERIYTTILNVVNKIIKFIKRTWTRISLAPVSDKEIKVLLDELSDLKGKSLEIDKGTHNLVKKHRAYFEVTYTDGFNEVAHDDLLKSSMEARKNMLDGTPINIDGGKEITKSYIKKKLTGKMNLDTFEDGFIFLSCKGKYVYLLGKYNDTVRFGSGFKVLSLEIDSSGIISNKKLIEKELVVDRIIDSLNNMMSIDELYRVVTGGMYEELEAIEHDLEADRLRQLKKLRSISNDTLDDLQVHHVNVQAHSKIVRTMAGFSKAFMYIGNGLIYDRKVRILTAKVAVNQLKDS